MAKQNRNQASAATRRAAQLDQLNNIGSNRSDFDTAAVFGVVEVAASDFILRVKENINSTKDLHSNTGQIEDITLQTTDKAVNILIKNHLLFQDKGVNGRTVKKYNTEFTYRDKRPPVNVFIELIKSQNIQLRNEENYAGDPSRFEDLDGDEKAIEKAAWAMSTKIWNEGFRGHSVYSKEIPQLIDDIQQQVSDFTVNFLTAQIINNDSSRSVI
jgi:hypothetical protein